MWPPLDAALEDSVIVEPTIKASTTLGALAYEESSANTMYVRATVSGMVEDVVYIKDASGYGEVEFTHTPHHLSAGDTIFIKATDESYFDFYERPYALLDEATLQNHIDAQTPVLKAAFTDVNELEGYLSDTTFTSHGVYELPGMDTKILETGIEGNTIEFNEASLQALGVDGSDSLPPLRVVIKPATFEAWEAVALDVID